MKINICIMLFIALLSFNILSQESADLGLTTFQMKEIEKKNKSANILIISGAVATALGGVMVGTWIVEDDSLVVVSQDSPPDTISKSPVRLISGVILGATGIALEVGGIIQKVKARKMKKQFIENNQTNDKVSFYIKPNGVNLIYRF